MEKHDVTVAYRICPKLSSRAYVLGKWDKYKLSEICLRSLIRCMSSVNFKLYAILDACPEKYEILFRDLIPDSRLKIVRYPGIGNTATFAEQIRVLLAQNDSDLVYFAEDDYFYLEDSYSDMLQVIERKDVDFVTPYDHPDYYRDGLDPKKPSLVVNLHNYESKIILENRHWRTASSTCCTFLTTKSTLAKTSRYLGLYPILGDYGMWVTLTRLRSFRATSGKLITLRKYSSALRQTLTGKSYKLWSPIPSIATHMARQYLAPAIDWQAQIQKYE